MIEEWKVIEEATNYSISNLGEVKNNKTNRIRRLKVTKKGYYEISLISNAGESLHRRVHRLVAEAFIPLKTEDRFDSNGEERNQVDHIDMDKSNNTVSNLRWCSNSENTNYFYGGLTKEERESERVERAKIVKKQRERRKAERDIKKKQKEEERRSNMKYGSVENMIKETAKSVKVNGKVYQSATMAARYICEDTEVTAKVETVRKEIRNYILGRRPAWSMYGKYYIS